MRILVMALALAGCNASHKINSFDAGPPFTTGAATCHIDGMDRACAVDVESWPRFELDVAPYDQRTLRVSIFAVEDGTFPLDAAHAFVALEDDSIRIACYAWDRSSYYTVGRTGGFAITLNAMCADGAIATREAIIIDQ